MNAMKKTMAKALRRLLREESGQTMMEYVVVAVMIAAACAVGFWYFGRSVQNEARVASHAVTADNTEAITKQDEAQQAVQKQDAAARERAKEFIKTSQENEADL